MQALTTKEMRWWHIWASSGMDWRRTAALLVPQTPTSTTPQKLGYQGTSLVGWSAAPHSRLGARPCLPSANPQFLSVRGEAADCLDNLQNINLNLHKLSDLLSGHLQSQNNSISLCVCVCVFIISAERIRGSCPPVQDDSGCSATRNSQTEQIVKVLFYYNFHGYSSMSSCFYCVIPCSLF